MPHLSQVMPAATLPARRTRSALGDPAPLLAGAAPARRASSPGGGPARRTRATEPVSASPEATHRLYLDHQASTPMTAAALAILLEVSERDYANPSSTHRSGKRAAARIETAREQLADATGALPEEIVFTGGATEANNLAILGAALHATERGRDPKRRRIITLPIEHPSVLAPARHLAERGFRLDIAPVQGNGRIRLDALDDLLGEDVLLLSIQTANNEIGTIQPVAEAAALAREHGALVHTDAAQALGRTPLDVEAMDVDFASLSAHKCGGPKGVGALFVREGPNRAPILPITYGGGHERGLRPGTQNTPGIASFGIAATEAVERLRTDAPRLAALRDELEAEILSRIPDARINGAQDHRVPNATSITFPGVDADALIARLPDLDLSAASACHAGTPEPSHVLRAIGLTTEDAYSTLRLSLGPYAAAHTIPRIALRIADQAPPLRAP